MCYTLRVQYTYLQVRIILVCMCEYSACMAHKCYVLIKVITPQLCTFAFCFGDDSMMIYHRCDACVHVTWIVVLPYIVCIMCVYAICIHSDTLMYVLSFSKCVSSFKCVIV